MRIKSHGFTLLKPVADRDSEYKASDQSDLCCVSKIDKIKICVAIVALYWLT